jgi:Tol biopolymer transport system component
MRLIVIMNSLQKPVTLYRVSFLFFLFLAGVFYWRCDNQVEKDGAASPLLNAQCLKSSTPLPVNNEFSNPEKVIINGYTGNAMEPFISRDGNYLFFKGLSEGQEASLCYAGRVDDVTFNFIGKINGVNRSIQHHGAVPSMDMDGRFYFVSTRNYPYDHKCLYSGNFLDGTVYDLDTQPGNFYVISKGWMVTDAEVSPNGTALYFVNAHNDGGSLPDKSDIGIAHLSNGDFIVDGGSREIMKNINNEDTLEYAPSINGDGLELFFTRFNQCTGQPEILVSKRNSVKEPFAAPERIGAMSGYAEAPSISLDKKRLYYHSRDNGAYAIYRVSR